MKKFLSILIALLMSVYALASTYYYPSMCITFEEGGGSLLQHIQVRKGYAVKPMLYATSYNMVREDNIGISGAQYAQIYNSKNTDEYYYRDYKTSVVQKGGKIYLYGSIAGQLEVSGKCSITIYGDYDSFCGFTGLKSNWTNCFDLCKDKIVSVELPYYSNNGLSKNFPFEGMFEGWSNLETIIYHSDIWDEGFKNWVKDVADFGVFVCPENLDIIYGNDFIPENWAVQKIPASNIYMDDETIKHIHLPYNYVSRYIQYNVEKGKEIVFTVIDIPENSQPVISVKGSQEIEIMQTGVKSNEYKFVMPNEDVNLKVGFEPITYEVTTNYPEYVTFDKSLATIDDKVSFTVKDRTTEGYQLDKIILYYGNQSKEIKFVDLHGSFDMKNYLDKVTVDVQYSKIQYNISSDEYISVTPKTAGVDDEVIVTVKNRPYYILNSVTYNGNILDIVDNSAIFYMPNEDVEIKTHFSPVMYEIITNEYVSVDKNKASIEDEVCVTVADRTAEGYALENVLINNQTFAGSTFAMKDYLQDVYIKANYSKISYKVISDNFSNVNKNTATVGEEIVVNINNRIGYIFLSATCNGKYLSVIDGKATFIMPAEDVIIETSYNLIEYKISTLNNAMTDKKTATINDFVVLDYLNRSSEGYRFDYYLINNNAFYGTSIRMKDYLENLEIKAVYSQINYTITTDNFTYTNQKIAHKGDKITVFFSERPGYEFVSAEYNEKTLSVVNKEADFLMPADNVNIRTNYAPIMYRINAGNYVSVFQITATVEDIVRFSTQDRSSEGLKLDKVMVNNVEFSGTSFAMKDYMKDVTISATYTPIKYNIVVGDFVTVDKSTATVNDKVNFTIKDRISEGYKLDKVLVNNTAVSGTSFAMKDFLKDVTVNAIYTPIQYKVIAGDFVTIDKSKATVEDNVAISAKDRTSEGYKLDKVFVNNVVFTATSFAMKDYMKDVTISATYTPIQYTIVAGDFVSVDKPTATVNDNVVFSVKDRTYEGYKFDKVLVNNTVVTGMSFAMKDYLKDVTISATYTPIQYNIVAGDFVTVDKSNATVEDKISFYAQDRTTEGYKLDKVLVNDVVVSGTSFYMKNYLKDVEVNAIYSKIDYPITTDNSVSVNQSTANIGDKITITVKNKDGYTPRLIINGEEVQLTDNQCVYTVTSDKIDVKVVYDENKPTPISEVSAKDNIVVTVFPNPVKQGELFKINIDGISDLKGAEIQIYDSMGRLVKRLQNVFENSEINLKSGVYNGVFVNKTVRRTFRIIVR